MIDDEARPAPGPRELERQVVDGLRDLSMACSAHLIGAKSKGSGFFIDDRHVLTCAHVVKGGEGVKVQPYRGEERPGHVVDRRAQVTVDLALVEVEWEPGDETPPAVVLDKVIADGVHYHAVGYPKADYVEGPGIEAIEYRGHARRSNDGGSTQLLMLEAGRERVTSGLSGGAVLSGHSGAVVALVQYSHDTVTPAGGAAIPVARAAREFKLVRTCIDKPPAAARRWRDLLGMEGWRKLGKPWGWERQLDVWVTGDQREWTVRIDPDDAAARTVTVRDLPDDVSEALFRWAQRGSLRDEEQVRFVGRLLSRALFVEPAMQRMVRERLEDQLLIRLWVDIESPLFDVPWELMTLDVEGTDRHIAAEQGLELVRVSKHATPEEAATGPALGDAHVLGIVVQPDEWLKEMPTLLGPEPVLWPTSKEVEDMLRKALATAPKLHPTTLRNPTNAELTEALQAHPNGAGFDVVHYIGFGQMENGTPGIALSDGYSGVQFHPVTDVLEKMTKQGARLIIIEFALPRYGVERAPVPPNSYASALNHTVNAIVFTRLPVHPRQFGLFNESLYRWLGKGMTVESSVQHARATLSENKTLADAGCFGWFSVLTGENSGATIVPPTPAAAGAGAKRQPDEQPVPAGVQVPDEREPEFTFTRGAH